MKYYTRYAVHKDQFGCYRGIGIDHRGQQCVSQSKYFIPNMKGGHTHNHLRNALERKLNKSKTSRNRCHNYLNRRGF